MEKDDDYNIWDDDFTDWKFHSLLCELERNGTILRQWEQSAPNDNATKTKTNENEKRETIQ